MILDHIGLKYGTDKTSNSHNYLVWYERFLKDIRDKDDLKILEIGVGNGASLYTWRDYFQGAKVVGFDIGEHCNQFADIQNRVHIEIGDQSNREALQRVGTTHGPFDLIVDDGSHDPSHQMFSLATLCPIHMKPGGFYILEDIMTDIVVNYLSLITQGVVRRDGSWPSVETIAFYEESTVIRLKS